MRTHQLPPLTDHQLCTLLDALELFDYTPIPHRADHDPEAVIHFNRTKRTARQLLDTLADIAESNTNTKDHHQ